MFRGDAWDQGGTHGMWAPEEGRGAGGAWGALSGGDEERESGGWGCTRWTASEGDEQDQEEREVALLLEDDLDFQVASY
ncbi:hypothetical protein MYSTI_05477 [Myxococcus stipitatus DSM 14675]|uniref:Uncharacterized protein n=1 Tax=Myxococcus stipitatus (strain DSM 14675 / JCM 12634 / Mx s8) TaxID=1278073 RepID=L7UFU1_MYXSD|nr:hypothetical protein MYSTI_05477 [Myxococcus stipitatus DSM 14675]